MKHLHRIATLGGVPGMGAAYTTRSSARSTTTGEFVPDGGLPDDGDDATYSGIVWEDGHAFQIENAPAIITELNLLSGEASFVINGNPRDWIVK